MVKRIQIDIDNAGITHVQLVRADKHNALDLAAFGELTAAAAQLRANNAVRVVVMSGQGPAFCAGIDTRLFAEMHAAETLLRSVDENGANGVQRAVWAWRLLPVPVIAAVHGSAFGGGLQLMSAADIRCVHPATQLSIMEIEYGIVPDMSGTQLWKGLVRTDAVRELTYTARIFSGSEAQVLGFATHVTEEPLIAAMEIARAIAAKNPQAIRAAKRLFNAQLNDSTTAGLQRERDEQLALLFSSNQREAVAAKMEKRTACFVDPEP